LEERKFRLINEKDAKEIKLEAGKPLIIKDVKGDKVIALHLGALEPFGSDPPFVNIVFPDGFLGMIEQTERNSLGIRLEEL